MNRRLFLMSVTMSGLFAATASAQAPQATYKISAKCSGLYLTVRCAANGECILIQAPDVPGDLGQQWMFVPTPDGFVQIVNPSTGRALEVVDGRERTPVLVYPARQSPTQNWAMSQFGGTVHYVFMPALHGDRLLDVPASATHVTQVQIYRPNYSAAQLWNITQAP